MEFNDQHPKVLLNFDPDNIMAAGFFVYLQDKVPFMDCVSQGDSTETWVEHTQRHGLFDLYFHLIDNTPLTQSWLQIPIYHDAYYIDTRGEVFESEHTTPTETHIITASTHEELWEDQVKRRYLQRPSEKWDDKESWRKGTLWERRD